MLREEFERRWRDLRDPKLTGKTPAPQVGLSPSSPGPERKFPLDREEGLV